MNDYISRQAAIAAIHELKTSVSGYDNDALDVSLIYEVLGEIPAAEAWNRRAELTGEWLEDEYGYCRCSICGYEHDDPKATTPYCPNCGAKMEEIKRNIESEDK